MNVLRNVPRLLRGKIQSLQQCSRLMSNENFNNASTQYIDDMFQSWLTNPTNVHPTWDLYFQVCFNLKLPFETVVTEEPEMKVEKKPEKTKKVDAEVDLQELVKKKRKNTKATATPSGTPNK